MNWTERRQRMCGIVAGDRCVALASVHDGISARIAEEVGFEAMMLAGSVASCSVVAAPDMCVLTLTEFAGLAYRINRAGNLPLLVDADHGYGNALSVKRTVEELETAGVSALTIEDSLLPTPFAVEPAQPVISLAEAVGKMQAAVAGRQDPSLVIVARISNISAIGVAEAIERYRAYAAAGVDMLFLGGLKTRSQLDDIAGALKLPFCLGVVPRELREPDYLSARNVKTCLQGHQAYWASVNATYETMKALRAGIEPEDLEGVAPDHLQKRVVRNDQYRDWERQFLHTDKLGN